MAKRGENKFGLKLEDFPNYKAYLKEYEKLSGRLSRTGSLELKPRKYKYGVKREDFKSTEEYKKEYDRVRWLISRHGTTEVKPMKGKNKVGLKLEDFPNYEAYVKVYKKLNDRLRKTGSTELKPRKLNVMNWEKASTKRHIKEAESVDLTLLDIGKDNKYRTYRFNKCGHIQEIRIVNVRLGKGNFSCNTCQENKLKKEAKKVGLTLIGAGRSSHFRTYRFNFCGHTKEITVKNVRKNEFSCNTCQENKLKKEAKKVGLTLLGSGRDTNYRIYRFNKCGHKQEITVNSVRINSFTCNTCEETYRDLPSKVYLLKITVDTVIQSFTWLKLGYAKTVSLRIKQYGLPSDAVIEKLKVMNFETGRQAHRYEKSLHTKYLRKQLPIKKMKEFHTRSGYNECYPLEMLDTLTSELEAKEKRLAKSNNKQKKN